MTKELIHKSAGTALSQAEFEATDEHQIVDQATDDIIVATSATQLSGVNIPASRIVGKKSTGNIAALTAADVLTILMDTGLSKLMFVAPTELTLDTNGDVTVTQVYHTLDTFEDAATDDLRNMAGIIANCVYIFRAAHADREVVIKTTSTIKVLTDFHMNNVNDILVCIADPGGTFLIPLLAQNNGA
jgi:hypothetical protein